MNGQRVWIKILKAVEEHRSAGQGARRRRGDGVLEVAARNLLCFRHA